MVASRRSGNGAFPLGPRQDLSTRWRPAHGGSLPPAASRRAPVRPARFLLAAEGGLFISLVLFGLVAWLGGGLRGVEGADPAGAPRFAFHVARTPGRPPAVPAAVELISVREERRQGRALATNATPPAAQATTANPAGDALLFPEDLPAGPGEVALARPEGRPAAAARGEARALGGTAGGADRSGSAGGPKVLHRTSVQLKRQESPGPPPRRVVAPPRLTYQPRLAYPDRAREKDLEGSLRVRVLVSEKGTVARYEVLEAVPPGVFEKSAEETIPLWRYAPAQDETGRPIECFREYSFVFKLEGTGS